MAAIFDSLFASNGMLTEQIAREVFTLAPSYGLFLVIADNDHNYWCSDESQYAHFFGDDTQIQHLCERIDDGHDPVVSQVDDCGVVATQLTAGQKNCGYLIAVLTDCTPESTLAIIHIIEFLLAQIDLIGKLIDKNNQLHHTQLKRLTGPNSTIPGLQQEHL